MTPGKFLPYKYYGAEDGIPEYGFKEARDTPMGRAAAEKTRRDVILAQARIQGSEHKPLDFPVSLSLAGNDSRGFAGNDKADHWFSSS